MFGFDRIRLELVGLDWIAMPCTEFGFHPWSILVEETFEEFGGIQWEQTNDRSALTHAIYTCKDEIWT